MGKFVAVLPLTRLEAGDGFAVEDWPLHVTIVPPFETDATAPTIAAALRPAAATLLRLHVLAGPQDHFGPSADVTVNVIESPELPAAHRALTHALEPAGIRFDTPAHAGGGFRAHVTVTRSARVEEGESFALDQLAVVDMQPPAASTKRTVAAVFDLG